MKDHYFHNKIVKICRAEVRKTYGVELEEHQEQGKIRPNIVVGTDIAVEVVMPTPEMQLRLDKYKAKFKKLIIVIPGEESIDEIWLYNANTDSIVKTTKIENPNKEGI